MKGPDVSDNIRAGDLGTAKLRLASSLRSHGYNAEVCGRIGDLCRDMKDPCEAGRWYFLSNRQDNEIADFVSLYYQRNRNRVEPIVSGLPKVCRVTDPAHYPDVVTARFNRIGAEAALRRAQKQRAWRQGLPPGTVRAIATRIGCSVALLTFVCFAIFGFIITITWLIKLL